MSKRYVYNDVFAQNDATAHYLLGAFITDGCMARDTSCFSITSKDKDWLELITNIICPNKPLHKPGKNCYRASFTHTQMYDWLVLHEVVPAKSLTVRMPTIPIQYERDFLRGVIDGDSSIVVSPYSRWNRKKTGKWNGIKVNCFIYSASEDFLQSISNLLNNNGFNHSFKKNKVASTAIDGREIHHRDYIYRIALSDNIARKLLGWVYYPGNSIAMSRKTLKVLEALSSKNNVG